MLKALALAALGLIALTACGERKAPPPELEGSYEAPLEKDSGPSAPGQDQGQPSAITRPEDIVFPVAGPHRFSDTWGAPRGGGRIHTGTDILADKMVPVVAAADGIVSWAYDVDSGRCCYLAIDHPGGWQTRYIHLNNDTPGTDDGKGAGIVQGIEPWVEVKAGQNIGWVGDSGNAESTVSHLHFEILVNDEFTNPYENLLKAKSPQLPLGN